MSTHALPTYVNIELRRQLRMFSSVFFMVVLPIALYLIFGGMQEFATFELPNGRGNISGSVAIAFAAYGAITATAGLAGSAALEMQQGWGRQLALTPFSSGSFVAGKTIVALALAVLPVLGVYGAGMLTSARMQPWVWVTAGLIIVAASSVFALYGLAIGLWFRSEGAVSAASGMIVILMFLGNAFVPLSGFLQDFSVYTPVWGIMQLAQWPLLEGVVSDSQGNLTEYALWQPIVNVVVWVAVFAIAAYVGTRRGTARR
ncbi:ABC transporter permease [Gulosibacter bifidus]|uniref:ABC transporter permease n=1 Tax=Gulosibacter bifidus TaxID=272239 RepID=A0ABW5RIC1_9MICO|nr:ABC transporter [Gulosibacter bifidus]